ncbi:hypothetical protein FJQ98_06250 [Lysinibacillus agricola]|uniref:Coupling factor for flagellin transcription and translation n=1 Tax=Lysinibacillus agricola TaxID=2590012 RepID=A0ABX7AXQ4_9BACI|nr:MULTISPECIES: hypothetical protein [Lysinibacillus]KOS62685.1 hypothetical protein AN161_10180 [Lysinibacillus sp. FJAT-14222]QQP13653.1 hypothetical protein FJQ98_06250 [Lysinibacillus agricola]
MTIILIAVLFILQLLSFYFLIILNTKLAKFKDLEIKQERLMREMDDTISVYLAEVKDENNRLIEELQSVSTTQVKTVLQDEQIMSTKEQIEVEKTKEASSNLDSETRIYVPKNIVANAYSRHQQSGNKSVQSTSQTDKAIPMEEPKPLTIEQQAVQLAKQGKTSEEIAKQLQKGKTEIELLLKFHS